MDTTYLATRHSEERRIIRVFAINCARTERNRAATKPAPWDSRQLAKSPCSGYQVSYLPCILESKSFRTIGRWARLYVWPCRSNNRDRDSAQGAVQCTTTCQSRIAHRLPISLRKGCDACGVTAHKAPSLALVTAEGPHKWHRLHRLCSRSRVLAMGQSLLRPWKPLNRCTSAYVSPTPSRGGDRRSVKLCDAAGRDGTVRHVLSRI